MWQWSSEKFRGKSFLNTWFSSLYSPHCRENHCSNLHFIRYQQILVGSCGSKWTLEYTERQCERHLRDATVHWKNKWLPQCLILVTDLGLQMKGQHCCHHRPRRSAGLFKVTMSEQVMGMTPCHRHEVSVRAGNLVS